MKRSLMVMVMAAACGCDSAPLEVAAVADVQDGGLVDGAAADAFAADAGGDAYECVFVPADYGITQPIVGFKAYDVGGACVYSVTVLQDGQRKTIVLRGKGGAS